MATGDGRLAIHVLGAARGESIILELPDGRWGVVDCCASSNVDPDANATLAFLRGRGVERLEFLCLTHPHDDHYRGMSGLLAALDIRAFWRFPGSGANLFRGLVALQLLRDRARGAGREGDAPELGRIIDAVARRRKGKSKLIVKRPGPGQPLYPAPGRRGARLRILGLAPTGGQVDRFEAEFAKGFDQDLNIDPRKGKHSHPNWVSVALLVCFGETRIVLGGDVERAGWLEVMREVPELMAAHAVKVSHHGSETGYCQGLWAAFASRSRPIAVVTSYRSQSLPRKAALDHIGEHASPIYATCLPSIRETQWPSLADPGLLRSRLALMSEAPGLIDEGAHASGRCTLVFDDRGRCLEVELASPAAPIAGA